jgi:hypothetical protein
LDTRPALRTLCRLLLVGLLLGSSGAQAKAQAVQPTADAALLDQIGQQVGGISGRARLSEVELRILDQASLRDYLLETFQRDYLPTERESDQKLLLALGLIQPSDDVVQISLDLLSEQVLGVYDPDRRTMFLVQDTTGFGPAGQMTFAHEFEHALQDQYYGLRQLAPKHPDNHDRAMAIHALEEGDAVFLEGMWANSYLTPRELAEARHVGGSSGLLDRVPAAIRSDLLFPYLEGYRFVADAYHAAGDNYQAVDDLFKNPPRSTAQVMHPDKYRAGVTPVEVVLPDLTASLGPGWRAISSNVLGEFELRNVLQQYGERAEAGRVASHWSGDRWSLVEKDAQPALAWQTVWDSPEAAQAFFDAYGRGLRARFPAASVDAADDQRQALSVPGTASELRLRDTSVLFVIGADRPTAVALVVASGW